MSKKVKSTKETMQPTTNQSGQPAVSRSRDEIIEAEAIVSAMENTADARQAEYATYAFDVFRWLRGDDNSILGRVLDTRRRGEPALSEPVAS
jgi:hypothetical protein